jgi:putative tricarboxylic transport membrane protein
MWKDNDIIGSLVFLIFSLIGLFFGYRLPVGTPSKPGAGLFPFYLSVILLLLSLALFLKSLSKESKMRDIVKIGSRWKKLILSVIGLVAFAYVLKPVGFVLSSLFIFLLIMKFVEGRTWKITLVISISFTVIFYFVSVKYLNIPLPKGILPF